MILRSYRLGHAWLWESWSEALRERVDDSGELVAGQDESSAFMFAYVDRISAALVEEFGTERERMLRSAEQLRVETVQTIMKGDPLDTEAASRRLGYELRRHHVAMRVSSGATEVEGLERAVGEAVAALGGGEPLVIASGAARFDVWCGSFDPPATEALEHYEPPPRVLVAFGKPGAGVAGFRRSHEEAKQAARIGALVGDSRSSVTSYARVELIPLLATDLPEPAPSWPASSAHWPSRAERRSGCAKRSWPSWFQGEVRPGWRGTVRSQEHRHRAHQEGGRDARPRGQ